MNKKFEKIIDQTNEILPPFWQELDAKSSAHSEEYNDLYVSGKQRKMGQYAVELIEQADDMVIICSFLLADKIVEDAIAEASSRAVRVYIMLACEKHLGKTKAPDDEFGKECEAQHVLMLKRLGGKVLIRSASYYHAKIILIDPNKDNAQGLLLTANLTREAFERNQELAVQLSAQEITEAFELLKWAMFEYAEHQMLDNENFEPCKKLEAVIHPSGAKAILATTSEVASIQEQALNMIDGAQKQLIISSFSWDATHPLLDKICNKAKQGVEIIILARYRQSNMPALLKLKQAGVSVIGFKWLHAKAIWSDQNIGMVMSANIQADGLDKGFELGVLLKDDRANALKECLVGFMSQKRWHLHHNTELGDVAGEIHILQQNSKTDKLTIINDAHEIQLPIVPSNSQNDTGEYPNQKLQPNWRKHPYHKVIYKWEVKTPPPLPTKDTGKQSTFKGAK